MDAADAKRLAEQVALGEVSPDELVRMLQVPPVTDLGYATVDNQRGARTGTSEIVYGAGKTKEQVAGIVTSMLAACQRRVLVTRLDKEKAVGVSELLDAGGIAMEYDPVSRLGMVGDARDPDGMGTVLVICAGTSDLPVAEEAARTLEFLGNRVDRAYDVGVAGIHRLLACAQRIRDARVIVAVAGMEGALASVVRAWRAVRLSPFPPAWATGRAWAVSPRCWPCSTAAQTACPWSTSTTGLAPRTRRLLSTICNSALGGRREAPCRGRGST